MHTGGDLVRLAPCGRNYSIIILQVPEYPLAIICHVVPCCSQHSQCSPRMKSDWLDVL